MKITPLKDYIKINHDGKRVDFLRAYTFQKLEKDGLKISHKLKAYAQLLNDWLRSGQKYVVEDGQKAYLISQPIKLNDDSAIIKQWELQK